MSLKQRLWRKSKSLERNFLRFLWTAVTRTQSLLEKIVAPEFVLDEIRKRETEVHLYPADALLYEIDWRICSGHINCNHDQTQIKETWINKGRTRSTAKRWFQRYRDRWSSPCGHFDDRWYFLFCSYRIIDWSQEKINYLWKTLEWSSNVSPSFSTIQQMLQQSLSFGLADSQTISVIWFFIFRMRFGPSSNLSQKNPKQLRDWKLRGNFLCCLQHGKLAWHLHVLGQNCVKSAE